MTTPESSASAATGSAYPLVSMGETQGSPHFPTLENNVLAYWSEDETFRASVDAREGAEEFVFYDGPPFANGLPHYGHLLTGYVKDIVPRYQTLRGKQVRRVFGWDCHGLPAELEAEKQLGITDKGQIEAMGLSEFNAYCAQSVLAYAGEWRDYVTRQARWVDFDNGYKTMDSTFMESVMWAFKTLYDKGLIYQGFRVLPYSWAEHTPLSNQETRLDDSYKMRQDPTLTVTFPITGVASAASVPAEASTTVAEGVDLTGALALAWTTTPWTLPSNLALAVHPEVSYAVVSVGDDGAEALRGQRVVLAEPLVGAYAAELGENRTVEATLPGSALVGLSYTPIFPYFADTDGAFRILSADYVTTDNGTGIVHQAPAFGEEDMDTCQAAGIAPVIPVDMDGRFTSQVPDYEGSLVFDANKDIIKDLKAAGRVARHQTIEHSYPHSWRSGEPLIYMALPSWFVRVTEFRDRMVELNKTIEWNPAHIRDGQFGKWLEGARDWNISRNRYWGSPIPVWVSDDENYPRVDVYGSLDELERDFGRRPASLHRPDIDELTRPNPDDPTGRSTMRRVPEVLDCWFESGSMPFAQKHYPFENKEWFDTHSPADFIVEYSGQSRGWFYTLHVLSTALFNRPAFSKVVAHGIVLGDDGLKMSKSKGNYPNVNKVFERDGSDAMRWFLMSSPILRGGNLIVTEKGIREGVRQALLPLWNAYSFLQLYASRPATWRTDSAHVLDRYILAKLAATLEAMTKALDASDIPTACDELRSFLDALTNWYVRRSRARFWAGEDATEESRAAFDTLYTVLEVTCRLAAPLLPMATEVIWRGLTGGRSVHLADWPAGDAIPADDELVAAMDRVRQVCSSASSVRKAASLRVRLPLPRLTVAAPWAESLADFTGLIADEVNVKDVTLTDDVAAHGTFTLAVNAKVAGPRLGRDVQTALKAAKAGDYTVESTADGEHVVAGGIALEEGEYVRRLVATNPESTAALPGGEGLIVVDCTVTPELEAEGWAADRVREVQEARRASGFEVSDRVRVVLDVPEERRAWAEEHSETIAREVLAVELTFAELPVVGEESDGVVVRDLGDGTTGTVTRVETATASSR